MALLDIDGLEPGKPREYHWIGDPAVDLAASDVERWFSTGYGLVAKGGEDLCTFTVMPLEPTTLQIVYNHAAPSAVEPSPEPVDQMAIVNRNMPAVYRAAVAYAVTAIKNGPVCGRQADSGGLRLSDKTLATLDRLRANVPRPGAPDVVFRLVDHLGMLVLADSTATDLEKKV